jgi:RND family efflux transporter MFP subunit
MNAFHRAVRIALPFLVVAAGIFIMFYLEHVRHPPQKKGDAYQGVLVEVVSPEKRSYRVMVRGTGTVSPVREINVVPQVSGRVVYVSEKFVQGGRFRKGEVFFRLEDVDYRLALATARAVLAQAELKLTIEKTRGDIALKDWQDMAKEGRIEANPLIFRKPQLAEAEASFEAARASLRQAEINLERTVVKAPFNCIVQSEHIDEGEFVKSGSVAGRVFGTDTAEVVTPLPLDELDWIDIPENNGRGSEASVFRQIAGVEHRWTGYVTRALGDVEPKGRMARVVVEVPAPFARGKGLRNIRLYNGMFVNVEISGRVFHNVFVIPSGALREDSTVWIADADSRLEIRKIDILRMDTGSIVVRSGIDVNDRIVITDIAGAAPGMLLRVASDRQNGGKH